MIIDEHRHVGKCLSRGLISPQDIVAEMDRLDVDWAVLAPSGVDTADIPSPEEERAETENLHLRVGEYLETGHRTEFIEGQQQKEVDHADLFDALRKYPDRFVGAWFLNPHLGERIFGQVCEAVRNHGFRYIKLHPPLHAFAADDVQVLGPVMELAEGLNVPLWFHTSSGPGAEASRLARLARQFPRNQIIMGHVLVGDRDGTVHAPGVIEIVRSADNLWIDLSHGRGRALTRILSEAPSERLMLASDHPYGGTLEAYMDAIRHAALGDATLLDMVLGGNAARLMRLG